MTPSEPLITPPIEISMLCEAYARLLCQARTLRTTERGEKPALVAEVLDDLASHLHGIAPTEAWTWLDLVKRVLEIDETVTDPLTVLLLASVIGS